VPPPAKGAARIQVGGAATGQCGVPHTTIIPVNSIVGSTSPGPDRAVNGEGSARVKCSRNGSSFSAEIAIGPENINFSGTIGEAATEDNTVSHYDPDASQVLRTEGTGCTFSPHEVSDDRVWASFSCAELLGPPTHTCSATGAFVFENCD
jgi:hypothetical protein